MNFQIEQQVVALTNPGVLAAQHRVKGKTYIVLAIEYCKKCGRQSIHIGGYLPTKNASMRCRCNHVELADDDRGFTDSENFAPLEEIKESEKALESILNEMEITLN